MKSKIVLAVLSVLALAGCSTAVRPLVPDTVAGPTSYVCYSSLISAADEVLATAQRQCGRRGYGVGGLIGQEWAPLKCGLLTPTVAAFQCSGASPGR